MTIKLTSEYLSRVFRTARTRRLPPSVLSTLDDDRATSIFGLVTLRDHAVALGRALHLRSRTRYVFHHGRKVTDVTCLGSDVLLLTLRTAFQILAILRFEFV